MADLFCLTDERMVYGMSTRQYIGARYVPKFADPIEWNVNNSYEALTIVNYLGNSYTSKKSVPVGTAITNSEYWAVTGNYNSQIEQYRQDVENLADDVGEYRQEVEDIASDISEFEGRFKKRNPRRIILIGDSYGTSNGSGGLVINPTFPETVITNCKFPSGYIKHSFQNGAGFINGKFLELITGVVNSLSSDEKNEISDVMFFGGWNDVNSYNGGSTVNDFSAALVACKNYINENLPNATIHVGYWAASRYAYETAVYETVYGWYKVYSMLRGINFIANLEYCLHRYDFIGQVDMSHPSQSGVNIMARFVSSYILNGYADVDYQCSHGWNTIEAADNFTADLSGQPVFDVTVHNNFANIIAYNNATNKIVFYPASEGVPTARNMTSGSTQIVAKFTDRQIYGSGYLRMNIGIRIVYDTDKIFDGVAVMNINGGNIRIELPNLYSADGTAVVFNSVSAIYITKLGQTVANTFLV